MVLVNTVNAETQRVHQSGAGCGQADRKGKVKGGGGDVRGRFIVCRARRIARVVYPPGKGEPEKGRGVATQRVVLTAFCRVWRSRKKKK